MRLLLTGATGIVGAEVRDQLERGGRAEVVCVARRRSAEDGSVAWDMGRTEPPAELRGPWDAIVNCAADTRWSQTVEEARRANVASLQALAPLASPRTHVVHVSTAAVVGPRTDGSSEDPDDYRNAYEWSKAHAERLARRLFDRLTIVRPPLVIGRRADGRAARFAGMYLLLRGITASSVPAVVGDPDGLFDVVPVDDVARVIVEALDGDGAGEVLTVVCGEQAPRVRPVVERIATSLNAWRAERGLEPLDTPPIVAPDSWTRFYRPFAVQHMSPRQMLMLDLLDNFRPYLDLTEPFEPTHPVADAGAAIAPAVRWWAERNPRLASLAPRPWAAAA